MTFEIPPYLLSADRCEFASSGICYGASCAEPVKEAPTGSFFITMGHPGFNSRANNGSGYATRAAAVAAMKKYGGPR